MHIKHTHEFETNLTPAQRRVIRDLQAEGWAICALSPSFTGGDVYTRLEAEDAMQKAGYLAVYQSHV